MTAYTAAERQHALDLYKQHGPAEAGRQTGIPSATIRTWAKRSGETVSRAAHAQANVDAARLTWAQRRGELTIRSGEVAANLLEQIAAAKPREARLLSAAFAVVVDRAQLLAGDATARIETSDRFNREVGCLLDEFERHDGQPAHAPA